MFKTLRSFICPNFCLLSAICLPGEDPIIHTLQGKEENFLFLDTIVNAKCSIDLCDYPLEEYSTSTTVNFTRDIMMHKGFLQNPSFPIALN